MLSMYYLFVGAVISTAHALTIPYTSNGPIRTYHSNPRLASTGSDHTDITKADSIIRVKPVAGSSKAIPPQKPPNNPAANKPTPSSKASNGATPAIKVTRPTTPVDTCKLPIIVCEDDYDNAGGLESDQTTLARAIVKRGSSRSFDVKIDNTASMLNIKSLGYPSSSELFKTARGLALAKTVFDFNDRMDLKDFAVKDLNKVPTDYAPYVTEHIVELQTVKMFISAVTGKDPIIRLTSVADSTFFRDHWNMKLTKAQVAKRKNKPPIEMGPRLTLNDLVFEALGSSFNRKDFVLLEKELNSYKERLWSGSEPVEEEKFEKILKAAATGELPSNHFLSALRSVLSVYKYLEHPTVSTRMKNDIAHVKIELSNVKELTGKDVTSTTGQVISLPVLWMEFMTKQLAQVEKHGKAWLNARIKEAETIYDAYMKNLKKHQAQLETNEKQVGPAKQKYDNDRKAKNQKLEVELKQRDLTLANARKSEDAASKVVKDIEDEIDREPKQAQKKVIKDKKDLEGKKKLLKQAEKTSLDALKARNLKEREIHFLWPQAVDALVLNAKADQDQIAAYKRAVTAIKMPGAV